MNSKIINNINLQLTVSRFENGIKLNIPEQNDTPTLVNPHSIKHFLALPFSFYLLDCDGKTKLINQEGVDVCGYDSINQSIGKSLFDVSQKESAQQLIHNCQTVVESHSSQIFEEQLLRADGSQFQFLSIKSPWYNTDNQVIGVCGFSIVLGKHALAHSLATIANLGLLNANPVTQSQLVHLSKREQQCLHYTIKGYTAKRIARALGISYRTVQEYITNIRIKVGAESKADLIEMVMQRF